MLQSGHGMRDGRTDGWTDGVKLIYPPQQLKLYRCNIARMVSFLHELQCNAEIDIKSSWVTLNLIMYYSEHSPANNIALIEMSRNFIDHDAKTVLHVGLLFFSKQLQSLWTSLPQVMTKLASWQLLGFRDMKWQLSLWQICCQSWHWRWSLWKPPIWMMISNVLMMQPNKVWYLIQHNTPHMTRIEYTWNSRCLSHAEHDTVCLLTENQQLSWCQLGLHWWYRRLSLWQAAVPLVTTKLASWSLNFQYCILVKINHDITWLHNIQQICSNNLSEFHTDACMKYA